MDFTASPYQQTIPSKSSYVPSDNQLEYSDGQTIRFEIPNFMGFIDPRQTYLKYKVRVEGAPCLTTFDKKCGVHGLFSQLRIYDANSNLQMETIQSYSTLAQKLHAYSENTTIRNKRGITELVEYTSRRFDGALYDNESARNANNSMLYDSCLTGNAPTNTSAGKLQQSSIVNSDNQFLSCPNSNTCEVAQRLYSGVLGELSSKMFPALLTNGLRMEIDLNDAKKALQLWSGDGVCEATTGAPSKDIEGSCRFGIIRADNLAGAPAAPLEWVDLYMEKNAGYAQIMANAAGAGQVPTQPAIDAGVRPVRNQLVGALNLIKGKRLKAFSNAVAPAIQDLGLIDRIESNSGENGAGLAYVRVHLVANSATGGVALPLVSTQVGGAGRVAAGTAGVADNNVCFMERTMFFGGEAGATIAVPKIVLTDVELVVKTASPPKGYVEKLLKQAQTDEGATHDFMTYNVYRNNSTKEEQVLQINIPALNNRAVSCLTIPTENGLAEEVFNDNNGSVVDFAKDYNFLINNKSQPTRKVSLARCSDLPPLTEQTALWETEKALSTSKCKVRNLNRQDENFMICRALSRYGGVYPLVKDGGLQLKVEYKSTNPPQKNKLFISYIGGLRRLRVSKEGSFIEQ